MGNGGDYRLERFGGVEKALVFFAAHESLLCGMRRLSLCGAVQTEDMSNPTEAFFLLRRQLAARAHDGTRDVELMLLKMRRCCELGQRFDSALLVEVKDARLSLQ